MRLPTTNRSRGRSKAFVTHATIARRGGQELNRNDWLRDHPPGFIEYVEAMGPSGRYGRWLRSRKVVVKVDDSIFMHAGIRPDLNMSIDDINRAVEREIRAFDDAVASLVKADVIAPFFTLQEIVNAVGSELTRIATLINEKKEIPPEVTQEYVSRLQRMAAIDKWSLIAADGPLWFRGYATLPDGAQPQIEELLKRLGAARFVVGHSPRLPGNIQVTVRQSNIPDRHRHALHLFQGRARLSARDRWHEHYGNLHRREAAAGQVGRGVASITRRGASIGYSRRGTGPAVLMLQGAGVVGNGWRPQVDALAPRYTVITNDNRGIGAQYPRRGTPHD